MNVVFPILSHLPCEVGVIACHTQFDLFQIPRMVEKGGFPFFARNTLTSEGRGRHGWILEPVLFRHRQSLARRIVGEKTHGVGAMAVNEMIYFYGER